MSDKKAAYNYINSQGKAVAQTPGGYGRMGFRDVGPQSRTTASSAQSYMGNVPKGCTFSGLQQGAMKKK